MKLDPIKEEHIIEAANILDHSPSKIWSLYWLQLKNGKEYQFKEIIRKAYFLAKKVEIDKTFQSNDNNRSYFTRKFGYKIVFRIPDNVSFFTANELNYFASYAGQDYRLKDPSLIQAGKNIKSTIFKKTNIWINLISDGWEFDYDNVWQISGNFKSYSWGRLYKKNDKGVKVYFTFGVDAYRNALIYKLDCQKSQFTKANALTPEQVNAFERIVNGTGAQWNEIQNKDLANYNWELLREESLDFLGRYEFLYDEAVNAVRSVTTTVKGKNTINDLTVFPPPSTAHNTLPQKKYTFRGVVIDYDIEQKKNKRIGDAGEELVLEHEKKFLEDNNMLHLVPKVRKVKDGKGYDIRSYDINGNKKYIEVKTTTGINTRPFIMTDNEWEFMNQNADQYHLYRIYDFDKIEKRGKMFCISGNLNDKVFTRSKQIEVFLKSI